MSPLLWWIIPVVATTGAIAWVSWVGRPRRPKEAYDSVAAYQRFRDAIAAEHPDVTRRRRRR